MKVQTLNLLNHKYYYGALISILTNMAGFTFFWTLLSVWYMNESELFGFQTQIMTWILGTYACSLYNQCKQNINLDYRNLFYFHVPYNNCSIFSVDTEI